MKKGEGREGKKGCAVARPGEKDRPGRIRRLPCVLEPLRKQKEGAGVKKGKGWERGAVRGKKLPEKRKRDLPHDVGRAEKSRRSGRQRTSR